MMFLRVGLLLATVSLAFAPAPPVEPVTETPVTYSCPKNVAQEMNGCSCYESVHYASCGIIPKPFKLAGTYHLKNLVLRNTKDLPLITENDPSNNKLIVDNLVILQEKDAPSKFVFDNLEAILSISTKSIKIVSNEKYNDQELDVSDLPKNLESISISNVQNLKGLDLSQFNSLTHLALDGVKFAKKVTDLFLDSTPLKSVEMSEVTGLSGVLVFKPNACTAHEKIHIKLQNVHDLTSFDFTGLFTVAKCAYHIEISGDSKLSETFLDEQADLLLKNDAGTIYLIFSAKPVNCGCKLLDVRDKHAGYLHRIQCKNVASKNLIDLDSNDKTKICTPANHNGGH